MHYVLPFLKKMRYLENNTFFDLLPKKKDYYFLTRNMNLHRTYLRHLIKMQYFSKLFFISFINDFQAQRLCI